MDIQYSKKFKFIRAIVRQILGLIYPIFVLIFKLPKIASIDETIQKIIDEKCSICRFGDGELLYISEKRNLPFQEQDNRLRQLLITILKSNNDSILIGLPIGFQDLSNLKPDVKATWKAIVVWTYLGIKPYLLKKKKYYNASITRLYIGFKDRSKSDFLFKKVRSIWTNRNIILVEGEKSRLGVGNDLFDNANSVKRILGPSSNAFRCFDRLFDEALGHSDKNSLILVALGPTAKPLVFRLASMGYQSIDIGNLDTEYEWFRMGAESVVAIKGKYTSEAVGGRNVEDIIDEKYENQVVSKVLI